MDQSVEHLILEISFKVEIKIAHLFSFSLENDKWITKGNNEIILSIFRIKY